MDQQLPPWALVNAWLEIQNQDTSQNVKDKRLKMLIYYFGSIKSAMNYVEKMTIIDKHHSYLQLDNSLLIFNFGVLAYFCI